jgi:general secretion pathway protein J
VSTDGTNQEGFTLIEILVATFVMSVLSLVGVMILNDAVSNKQSVERVLKQVQNLELARAVIKSDLAQVSPRIPRDEFGYRANAPFMGGGDLDRIVRMSFVRNGNDMPGLKTSNSRLQYVQYRVEDSKLVRRSWARVDVVSDTPYFDRVLLNDVSDVQVLFFDGQIWLEDWDQSPDPDMNFPAPVIVSISFDHSRYGQMEMLFSTPAGA